MSRKKKWLIVVGAVVVLGAIIGISVYSRREDQTTVQTGKVAHRNQLIARVSAPGEIKPKEYVELQAEIAGVITDLRVREGDLVRKGDVLLHIDPIQTEADTRIQQALLDASMAELRNQNSQINVQESNIERERAGVLVAEAELERALQNLTITRSGFERKQQLYEDDLISKDLYDAARNDVNAAQAALSTAQARVEQSRAILAAASTVLKQAQSQYEAANSRVAQARASLERSHDMLLKTVIRSPLTGVITALNVEAGERAVPGTLNNPLATLMIIADLSIIEAEVEVDETDIVQVRLGQQAEIKVDALPDQKLAGVVTEIGNSPIQSQSGQQQAKEFKVVIQLNDPPQELRPGLSCTSDITTHTKQEVLTVPIQAVTIREFEVDEAGNLIRKKKDEKPDSASVSADTTDREIERKEFEGLFKVVEGRAVFEPIKTGIVGNTEIEVLSGVSRGDVIVTGNYQTLRTLQDGDKVKPEEGK